MEMMDETQQQQRIEQTILLSTLSSPSSSEQASSLPIRSRDKEDDRAANPAVSMLSLPVHNYD